MSSQKSLIWIAIRKAASDINKAGGNTIELLLWSQDRRLPDVQRRIESILETSSSADFEQKDDFGGAEDEGENFEDGEVEGPD